MSVPRLRFPSDGEICDSGEQTLVGIGGSFPSAADGDMHIEPDVRSNGRSESGRSFLMVGADLAIGSFAAEECRNFEAIASVPGGGAAVTKQRAKLLELLPTVQYSVDSLIQKAEKEALTAGEKLVHQNIENLVTAQQRAGAAKAVASRSGVPPDDPDFARVCQIEAQLERYVLETTHLHRLANNYRNEIEKWRNQVEEIHSQQPELLSIFKTARRQNQLFESVTRIADPMAPHPPNSDHSRMSLPGTLRDASGRSNVPKAATPPSQVVPTRTRRGMLGFMSAREPAISSKGTANVAQGHQPLSSRDSATRQNQNLDWLDDRISTLASKQKTVLQDPVASEESGELRYSREIRGLEAQIKALRKEMREMKEQQAKVFLRRGWQEEFFLHCMDDLKKHLFRKKNVLAAQQIQTLSRRYSPRVGALASSIGSSSGGSGGSSGHSRYEQMIEVLANSDDVLSLLFEKIFPHREAFSSLKARQRDAKTTDVLPSLPPGLLPDT